MGPLAGITVLDFTSVVAGPYATMLLGDLGARVIKIEPPSGDSTRQVGPAHGDGLGSVFLGIGRNKESLALDLARPEARGIVSTLAARADIVIHNMRPRAAAKLGIDAETLRAVHPELIHCSIAGFDPQGPCRDMPAYDDTIQGASGAVAMMQAMTGAPMYFPTLYVDKTVGLFAANAMLAALCARFTQGGGQTVIVPMYEVIVAFNLLEHLFAATPLPDEGPVGYPRTLSPDRRPFPTADGHVCALPYLDKHYAALFQLAGRPELIADDRFYSIPARLANVSALMETVSAITRTKTTAEWLELFDANNIPVMPVRSLDELLTDPQLLAAGLFKERNHPVFGAFREIAHPVRYAETQIGEAKPAPQLGEHGPALLSEFGFDETAIRSYSEAGILHSESANR